MSFDPDTFENDLRKFRPAALRPALLDRLDACASGTWRETSPAEDAAESRLAAHSPATLSPELMASLESIVAPVAFPQDRKIVLFPARQEEPVRRKHHGWYSAAAAVAICGALAALFVPMERKPVVAKAQPGPSSAPKATAAAGELTPAGFRRGISEARDEGVVWQSADKAHQVLRVVYKDTVTLKDPNGRIYQVEEPRVEYILVPARID